MAYIYKITNDINDKVYIGKTEFSLEKRWREHCNDCFRERNEKRPLYAAMRKYGTKNFHISLIEETDNPENREKYWIEQYGSFKYGYNATLGGDAKRYLDYDLIIATYQEVKNAKETAKLVGAHEDSVRKILKQKGVSILDSQTVIKAKYGKSVAMLNKDTNAILHIFTDQSEAGRWLQRHHKTITTDVSKISARIGQVASGKRKTAYGYKWKHIKRGDV